MAAVKPTCAGTGDVGAGSSSLAAEVAALGQLDAAGLRRRWRALIGGTLPADLGRPLTLRVLAYKLQAERLGDLDRACVRALAAFATPATDIDANSSDTGASRDALLRDDRAAAVIATAEPVRPALARIARPGTVLVREHGGVLHRVMVLSQGFAWNGRTFDSLSQVAFAITGTKWNGPRFFGLRDAPAKMRNGDRPRGHGSETAPIIDRGYATRPPGRSASQGSR